MRRPVKAVISVAMVLGLLLALGAGQALAAVDTYFEIGQFGKPIPGAGEAEFNGPRHAAVEDATGNVLVVDSANNRVQVFAPSGNGATFLTEFGAGTLSAPYGIAIDQGSGVVYVTDAGNNRIVAFESNGAATPTYSVDGSFTSPPQGSGSGEVGSFAAALAVDPNSGDLLVADPGNLLVQRFEANGDFVSAFDGSGSPAGPFTALSGIAVTNAGDVVVTGGNRADQFAPNGTHQIDLGAEFEQGSVPGSPAGGPVVAVDPNTGYTLIASGEGNALEEVRQVNLWVFDGGAKLGRTVFPVGGADVTGVWSATGVAADGGSGAGAGRAYVVTGQAYSCCGRNGVTVFKAGSSPSVSMEAPGSITATSVHLSGTVNPNGTETRWRFELSSDGGATWYGSPVPDGNAGSGSEPVSVAAVAETLQPNTTYQVRLIAENEVTSRQAAIQEFTTPQGAPSVYHFGAAPVLDTSARLNARVDPNGLATTYYFEFGLDTSYGTDVPAALDGEAGSGEEALLVSREVGGLQPGTTYHYRLVAENAAGVTKGPDTTLQSRTVEEMRLPRRGTELVSMPDKGYQSPFSPPQVSADGDRVFWNVPGGTPVSNNGSSGLFVAERTPEGWRSTNVLPPVEEQIGNGYHRYSAAAWTLDFSKFLVTGAEGALAEARYSLGTIDVAAGGQASLFTFDPLSIGPIPYATADISRVFAAVAQQIAPGHPEGGINEVYEFSGQSPRLVSVLPDGSVPQCGTATVGFGWGGNYSQIARTDGSRVFFGSSGNECSSQFDLFVRNTETESTENITESPVAGPGGSSYFVRATPNGRAALFDSTARLDPDDTNEVGDTYLYREGENLVCLTCVVSNADVDYGAGNGGDPSKLAPNDLSYIYFTSPNVLQPGLGRQGATNLYVYHDGEVRYIAPVGPTSLAVGDAVLSEDGRTLIFASSEPGVSTDETNGTLQMYRYSFADNATECVSCRRDGAPTEGDIPDLEARPGVSGPLSADASTLVFRTTEALVRRDVNGGHDVYEWHNGALDLVTDGKTIWPAGLLELDGISANGRTVLFRGVADLTGYERDGASQIFAARVDGGFPPPAPPPTACNEDSCQGPLQTPPRISEPGSLSTVGAGNAKSNARKKQSRTNKKKRKKASQKKRQAPKKKAAQKRRANAATTNDSGQGGRK